MTPFEEIEFRKRVHKRNVLRSMIREKKELATKLSSIPSCADEYLKLQTDIKTLEDRLNELP